MCAVLNKCYALIREVHLTKSYGSSDDLICDTFIGDL